MDAFEPQDQRLGLVRHHRFAGEDQALRHAERAEDGQRHRGHHHGAQLGAAAGSEAGQVEQGEGEGRAGKPAPGAGREVAQQHFARIGLVEIGDRVGPGEIVGGDMREWEQQQEIDQPPEAPRTVDEAQHQRQAEHRREVQAGPDDRQARIARIGGDHHQ